MSTTLPQDMRSKATTGQAGSDQKSLIRTYLFSWEMYLIVAVAAILRLYGLQRTEFDSDQADIFRMAYDALSHHLLVATSNVASLHIYNPPGIIYLLMIPAALSHNPVWAAVMVALLATISVLLTYIFVYRYYGRLAAAFAALLYATAALPIFYSRFIWQQNLLLFFVPLFIMLLFRGAVARRKGWLAPAIFLLGLLIQLHASSVTLAVPLLIAWILAPGTVCWLDIVLGALVTGIIYAPYVLWEVMLHFLDMTILRASTSSQPTFDASALVFYQQFLGPFSLPYNAQSFSGRLAPFVSWLLYVMTALLIIAAVFALVAIIRGRRQESDLVEKRKGPAVLRGLWQWFGNLRAQPYRCGLLVLFAWQAFPLIYLLRHTISLYPHYFIMFMPGPFIFIGILLAAAVQWLSRPGTWQMLTRYGMYTLVVVLVGTQLVASGASVFDITHGNFHDTQLSRPYYNDLTSMQQALHNADQFAQHYHLPHIYAATDAATDTSLRYLEQFTQVPTTTFSENCLVLPDPAQGPALLMSGPYSNLDDAILARFAHVTFLGESAHLGGAPYRFYMVQTLPLLGQTRATFSGDLQLLGSQHLRFQQKTWILTHWNILRNAEPAFRSTYVYDMMNRNGSANLKVDQQHCVFTSLHAGDQLVMSYQLPALDANRAAINIQVTSYDATPLILRPAFLQPLGIAFETYAYVNSPVRLLKTAQGQSDISIAIR